MSEANRWETLKALMVQESGLVNLFNRDEESLRTSLGKKDWFSVEKSIGRLQEYAGEIERVEAIRNTLWSEMREELGYSDAVPFTQNLSALPSPLKDELSQLYSDLRREAALAKAKLDGLRMMAETRTAMIRGVLEDLIPDARGNLYGQQGRPRPAVSGSLWLNTCH